MNDIFEHFTRWPRISFKDVTKHYKVIIIIIEMFCDQDYINYSVKCRSWKSNAY